MPEGTTTRKATKTTGAGPISEGWRIILGGGLIILAALAVYHNSFAVPFLLDDVISVTENPKIRHLWPIWDALSPSGASLIGGRPILNVSFAINYALGGTAVWGYHALNLAIHVLAGLTLFGVVRRTLLCPTLRERYGLSATRLALAAAVLWTVHPLQTEAVTYLTERCESLMGLFYLLTIYGFIRGVDSPQSGWWFALTVAACFLGMASKEVTVTAPAIVLLYDRTFVSGSLTKAWTRHRPLYLTLVGAWVFLGYLMIGLHNRGVGYGLGITWWAYALRECQVVVNYLWLAVWPHPLVFDYGSFKPVVSVGGVLPYALVLAALIAVVAYECWQGSAGGFLGAWFLVILAPTSSVAPIVGQPMAEHRMYLPLASVMTLVVLGIYAPMGRRSVAVFLALAVGLGFLTVRRNDDYRTELSIWTDTVAKCPDNARAHGNLGNALDSAGRPKEAISQWEQSLRIQPDLADSHANLGDALAQEGRLQEALGHYEQALRIKPNSAKTRYNMGNALQRAGKVSEAIVQYEQALSINPDDAQVCNNLGLALSQSGNIQEAIRQYQQALRINPEYVKARNNLGIALGKTGHVQEAIGQYEQALQIQPDYPEGENNLAWLLATCAPVEDPVRAVALAERACKLSGYQMASYVDTLAAAYAAAGRFSDAVAAAEKAIDLARAEGQPSFAKKIEGRLQSYRDGHPYRQGADATQRMPDR